MPTKPDVPGLRAALAAWLKANDMGPDVRIYSAEEWEERREPLGECALLHLTFEGPLYELVNYGIGPNATALYEEFLRIPERFGCWVEFGFAWSAHFYTRET